jgi:hypothetical protein
MSHKSQTISNIYFLFVAVMALSKDEHVGIILLCGGHSRQEDTETCNTHQEWSLVTYICEGKLSKSMENGSVLVKPCRGTSRLVSCDVITAVLGRFALVQNKSLCCMAVEIGTSKSSDLEDKSLDHYKLQMLQALCVEADSNYPVYIRSRLVTM